jgi:nitroreductase
LAETVLETIRSRRVTRVFDDHPVADESLLQVLEAGRWATSGGNRRIHPFLVVRDPRTLARLRAVTPGMFSTPPVVIVICTDATRAAEELVQLEHDTTTWIDVGTAAMNMMVAAHALELGSCPVTSFSHGAVSVVLGLPPTVEPELFLLLGHPHEPTRPIRPTGSGRTGATALPPGLVWWEQPGCATPESMPIQATDSMPATSVPTDMPRQSHDRRRGRRARDVSEPAVTERTALRSPIFDERLP